MPRLSVQHLFDERRERLGLAWAAGTAGATREFTGEMLHRPGVGLIGHLNLIHPLLAQVLGRREVDYIEKLEGGACVDTVTHICKDETVCVIICEGLKAPAALVECADRAGLALLTSSEPSQHVINVLRPYMQQELGEVTNLHGVMLDVLEIGVLITGDSSIGKSELALELISRGHGLVADDVVELQQIGPETIQARCPPMLRDFLEVRGLGVLNIRSIFGETAVRPRKALRLIVHLEMPEGGYKVEPRDRLATRAGTQDILGVEIPTVTLAVAPGRNLAVLVEAAVRNHILLTRGINSTREFIGRQEEAMRQEARGSGEDGG
ncbi:MAG TPA: HPr(Ser) kinase/phosphatase [Usitatibacter sp.]|jgi:HPr kinase/phosphorylase|nr:HPr(Ser) kinase/phosphatase [Usitatibacter sp.]